MTSGIKFLGHVFLVSRVDCGKQEELLQYKCTFSVVICQCYGLRMQLKVANSCIKVAMATRCVSLFKRRKTKSKLQKSPDNVTSCYQPIKSGSSSPEDAVMSGSSLNSPPPGTIFTLDNFSGMERTLVQRKSAKGLVEPGRPQLLFPIVVIFAEQQ